MTGMLEDIRRTPAVLQALAARAAELAAFGREHLAPAPGGRLFAFGCGDGLFAAEALAGDRLVARTALDMALYQAPRLTPGDRVLAISMSGNVDRTVEAAEAVRRRGVPLAVLTNGDGGRLGALETPRISLDIASLKPFLCGTSSYVGTLAGLALLTGKTLPPPLPDLVPAGLAAVAELGPGLTGVRFLSAGPNRATAAYGAAKLVEVTRLPSWSGDIEEFAHSQFWTADPGELIVYITASPAVAALASYGAEVLGGMGFRTLAVETADAPVPGARHRVTVPAVDEALSPLSLAVPLQLLAWQLARATGLDPDTRAHLKDDKLRFDTSRRLTRRSLLGTGH